MGYFWGHVAVITGAGGGIGRSVALELHKEGCELALSDYNESTLLETAELCREANPTGEKVSTHVVDMLHENQVHDLVESVVNSHGRVSIVINNAGISGVGMFEDVSPETFSKVMQVNFASVVVSCRAFLPHLAKEPKAHLVNVSSIFSIMSGRGAAAYHASKFALRGFTECLEWEFKELHPNISVHCVCPSGVKTSIITTWATRKGTHASASMKLPRELKEMNSEFQAWAISTPEEAAMAIAKGIAEKQSRILVGEDAKWIDRVVRAFPVSYRGDIIGPWFLMFCGILGRMQKASHLGDNSFTAVVMGSTFFSMLKIAKSVRARL